MLPVSAPYYTHSFGSLGQTLDAARSGEFLRRFHFEESSRNKQEPGELIVFCPQGEKFRDLCRLEVLAAPDGDIVALELLILRRFIEGHHGLSAQDLVKSFLDAALTPACKEALREFIAEMSEFGRNGETPGYTAFRGRSGEWAAGTNCSRLLLKNIVLPQGASLAVHIAANPHPPSVRLIPT